MNLNGDTIPALVAEFTDEIGLEPVDAYRSAFTALAVSKGWTKARVGRYLGISRARVGQRVDKLEHYAHTNERVPVLKQVMNQAGRTKPQRSGYDGLIEFEADDWRDLDFARTLLDSLQRSNI